MYKEEVFRLTRTNALDTQVRIRRGALKMVMTRMVQGIRGYTGNEVS